MVGEENERKSSRKMENFSLEMNRYPRDLLQRLSSSDAQQLRANPASEGEEEEEDELELNLGLSLGGRFGVDKTSNSLKRSSSIAGTIPLVRNHEAIKTAPVSYPVLTRTSSLPAETEEEWRKRKEIQSLRRMTAKRRRNEKQKNLNLNLNLEEDKRGVNISKGNLVPNWIRQGNRGNTLQVWVGQQQGSQGSLESQGGSSSGLSEIENTLPPQGSNSGGEARSSMSSQSWQDRSNQETAGSSVTRGHEITSITSRSEMDNSSKKNNKVENMPCVFTIGEGPKGRRVEGILYRYGKGEEVRIMCVCHGSFLSPAEFVKHARRG